MFGHSFYHELTRKYVVLFGNLFNNIKINRVDEENNTTQNLVVPIDYSPRRKPMALKERGKRPMIDQAGDGNIEYSAIQVPRMGFEITNISYDGNRQLQSTLQNRKISSNPRLMHVQYVPVPFTIDFNLYIIGKYQQDNLRIVEQILPFFTPDLVVGIKLVPDLGLEFDIPVEMVGQDFSDDYDGDISERRTLTWTLSFSMKCWYLGPVTKQGPIKKIIMDFYTPGSGGPVTGEDIVNTPRNSRVTIVPGLTADGNPTSDPNKTIPYLQINADDDFGFIETYEEFNDGKKRDPITGTDKNI